MSCQISVIWTNLEITCICCSEWLQIELHYKFNQKNWAGTVFSCQVSVISTQLCLCVAISVFTLNYTKSEAKTAFHTQLRAYLPLFYAMAPNSRVFLSNKSLTLLQSVNLIVCLYCLLVFFTTFQSPYRDAVSNLLVNSINANLCHMFCSWHLLWIWRRQNIKSMMLHRSWNPQWSKT